MWCVPAVSPRAVTRIGIVCPSVYAEFELCTVVPAHCTFSQACASFVDEAVYVGGVGAGVGVGVGVAVGTVAVVVSAFVTLIRPKAAPLLASVAPRICVDAAEFV